MQLSPANRLMSYNPAAQARGGAAPAVDPLYVVDLPAIATLPATKVPPTGGSAQPVGGSGQMQQSLESVLETIRQEAQKLMGGSPSTPSTPAPSSNGLFQLPGLEKILDGLLGNKPDPKPAPKPDPKPAPKPEPKPEPKPQPKPDPKPQPSNPGGTYTVKSGDSLSKIAGKTLGNTNRWREIYELNRDQISNPNVIRAGMVLKLPGGGNKPAPSTPPPSGNPGNLFARREAWYISQYGSKYNTKEDVPGYDNGNCGPTSLTMVAKAFGKINPNAAQADAAIEESRRRMGDGMNERSGTSIAGIARGAKSYGLSANVSFNANTRTIAAELAKGRLVIVHGTVIKDDGRTYGGHYYVVTKIEGGKAYLNDPAYPSGPRVIPASLLDKSINTRGTHGMISIGP